MPPVFKDIISVDTVWKNMKSEKTTGTGLITKTTVVNTSAHEG
jgi:ribosomal protein S8E